jgi:drug/metabolite transporter (DMT)-like permease
MNLKPIVYVLLAAVLFGVSTPLAKTLLGAVRPVALAGLLYLGVFLGLTIFKWLLSATTPNRSKRRRSPREGTAPIDAHMAGLREAALEKKDLPWLAGAILAGGILGPICLMAGLARISGFSASLLLNFEGAATAVIAVLLFGENAGRRVWLALAFMTSAGVFLSWNPGGGPLSPSGPVLILLAMICWGMDNNLTGRISDKDPAQIARIKGLVAGIVSTAAAFLLGQGLKPGRAALYGLAIGAVGYGLSLVLYVRALKGLGAFRTGLFFSLGPFAGALFSLVLLKDRLRWPMAAAAALMAVAVALMFGERHNHSHRHERLVHNHSHVHSDLHHVHSHNMDIEEPHSHEHVHETLEHVHGHWPDTHHHHGHGAATQKEES